MTIVYDIVDFDKPGGHEAFLHVCFGEDWAEKAFLVNEPDWGIRKRLEELDPTRGCYWSVGAIPWGKPRTLKNAENVRALVLDDVGTKIHSGDAMGLDIGMPTCITGTSEKNFQYVYAFAEPISVPDFMHYRKALLGELQGAVDGKDAVHFFRLPWGINRKPGKGMFKVNGRFGVNNDRNAGPSGPLKSVHP